MVHMGSRVERCHGCGELAVCGSFWFLALRLCLFLCARCLTDAGRGVSQASVTIAAQERIGVVS